MINKERRGECTPCSHTRSEQVITTAGAFFISSSSPLCHLLPFAPLFSLSLSSSSSSSSSSCLAFLLLGIATVL